MSSATAAVALVLALSVGLPTAAGRQNRGVRQHPTF